MPWCATSEAATSSWVESGFDEQRTASAPPACRVRIRFAVSAVTCRQALIFQPASGRSAAKRSRMPASTGIWRSAHSIFSAPASARPMSRMSPFSVSLVAT